MVQYLPIITSAILACVLGTILTTRGIKAKTANATLFLCGTGLAVFVLGMSAGFAGEKMVFDLAKANAEVAKAKAGVAQLKAENATLKSVANGLGEDRDYWRHVANDYEGQALNNRKVRIIAPDDGGMPVAPLKIIK